MTKKIQFRGSISPLISAIQIGGDLIRVKIDIPRSEHQNAVALQALLDVPLKFTVELDNSPASERIQQPDDQPTSKTPPKERSGPYDQFWKIMVIKGVKTFPDLQVVLDCPFEGVWDGLHAVFDTHTMSTVSPRQWEAWVEANELPAALITMSRNAEVQAVRNE